MSQLSRLSLAALASAMLVAAQPACVGLNTMYASPYFRFLLRRKPNLAWFLDRMPDSTLFEPNGIPTSFPAFPLWLFDGWKLDRNDYYNRLNALPHAESLSFIFNSSAPVGWPPVTYLPHTVWAGSFAPWEVLEIQGTGPVLAPNTTFWVDTPVNFNPTFGAGHSPIIETEIPACNGLADHLEDFNTIHPAADPYMRFPKMSALDVINTHPNLQFLRKLFDLHCASCPLRDFVSKTFTMLLPTDQAFETLTPEARSYLLADSVSGLATIYNHILGPSFVEELGLLGGRRAWATSPTIPPFPPVNETIEFIQVLGFGLGLLDPFPSYWYHAQIMDAIQRAYDTGEIVLTTYTRNRLFASAGPSGLIKFSCATVPASNESCCQAYTVIDWVDIETTNALLHKINNVLLPGDVVQTMHSLSIPIYRACPVPGTYGYVPPSGSPSQGPFTNVTVPSAGAATSISMATGAVMAAALGAMALHG